MALCPQSGINLVKINKLPNIYNAALQHLKGQYYKSVSFMPYSTTDKLYFQTKCPFPPLFPMSMWISNIYIQTLVEDKVF